MQPIMALHQHFRLKIIFKLNSRQETSSIHFLFFSE